ncbi:MAG: hypothetical protein H0W65_02690 [Sphingomonas sp.]|uniref:hypothetical protein n=1 Tax=Sphingomonas sp. TaxID=28214 RepID=UPI001852F673|nr:hypothetical protein [Sphingomonas sp.]MBA3666615.1 hypothetical protein [Sphingomonas sp.]
MSNIAGKAYGMTVVTPMSPRLTWLCSYIFRAVRCFPATLGPLIGLSIIHFARWAIIRRDQWPNLGNGPERLRHDCLLFCSNFNGTWDQYIDAFSAGVPAGLNLLWYRNVRFPGAVPNTPFKEYIRVNQLFTDFYYNATPGVAQRDIKSALRVRQMLLDLERAHARLSPAEFAGAYRAALIAVQNDLGSHGPSPVASTDTATADANKLLRIAEGQYAVAI